MRRVGGAENEVHFAKIIFHFSSDNHVKTHVKHSDVNFRLDRLHMEQKESKHA